MITDAERADAKILAAITTADELAQFLLDRWHEHVLDDDVRESKDDEAGQINGAGMGEQIAYLAGGADVSSLARALAERLYRFR